MPCSCTAFLQRGWKHRLRPSERYFGSFMASLREVSDLFLNNQHQKCYQSSHKIYIPFYAEKTMFHVPKLQYRHRHTSHVCILFSFCMGKACTVLLRFFIYFFLRTQFSKFSIESILPSRFIFHPSSVPSRLTENPCSEAKDDSDNGSSHREFLSKASVSEYIGSCPAILLSIRLRLSSMSAIFTWIASALSRTR